MAAKKKSVDTSKVTWGKTTPKESVGSRGKKYSAPKGSVKTTSLPKGKTPVKKATSGFAGSGSPLGTSFGINPASKGQVANAALVVASTPGSGKIVNALTKVAAKQVRKVAGTAGVAAARAATPSSIGMGGRLYVANTVTGKQLASTSVRSAAQRAASAKGLVTRAGNIGSDTALEMADMGARVIAKGVSAAKKAGTVQRLGTGVVVAGKTVSSVNKGRNRKK